MRARRFAIALRGLLRRVEPKFAPRVSEVDIRLGEDWRRRIDEQIRCAKAGIVVLTPENCRSPWLLYEAGRMVERAKADKIPVIPMRVDLPVALLPEDFPLSEQYAENTENGVREVVRRLSRLLEPALPRERLDASFQDAWQSCGDDLRGPDAVFRGETAQGRRFCYEVFLDIAKASMVASCRSLLLYGECSRIIALTDWSKLEGAAVPAKDADTARKARERLAREFEAAQYSVQAVLSEESSLGTALAADLVGHFLEACEVVHSEVVDSRILEIVENDHMGSENHSRLTDFVELSRTYRNLRKALATRKTARECAESLSSGLQNVIEDWQKALPSADRAAPRQSRNATKRAETKRPSARKRKTKAKSGARTGH